MSGYRRIAEAFHQRIDCIVGAVDAAAPGIEAGAALLTEAALRDRKILVCGTSCDAGLAQSLAECLRGAEATAPALPALAIAHDDIPRRDSVLWRDLRLLARDGDVVVCLDSTDGAATARACAELAAERNLYLVTLSEPLGSEHAGAIGLAANTAELRRELMLMACHCLQSEIRHLLMGD
jgi:phosphoheptose isomerase